MSVFDRHHPRIYHFRPDEYPLGDSHLDFIAAYDPAAITDYEPTQQERWRNILHYLEGLVRADKAQLAADREAARRGSDQPEWHPAQSLLPTRKPSGQP